MLKAGSRTGAVIVALMLTGCGSSETSEEVAAETPEDVVATSAAPAPDVEEPEPPASTGRNLQFKYTNKDGWEYADSIEMPDATVTLTKDISSSPPGRARAAAQVDVVLADLVFSPVNPGRPNGPSIKPTAYLALPGVEGRPSAGLCRGDDVDADAPFKNQMICYTEAYDQDYHGGQRAKFTEVSEALVDELVASAGAQPPTWLFNFAPAEGGLMGGRRLDCDVWVSPGETTITKAPTYTDDECGVLDASVT